jgi:hypothetical protein
MLHRQKKLASWAKARPGKRELGTALFREAMKASLPGVRLQGFYPRRT